MPEFDDAMMKWVISFDEPKVSAGHVIGALVLSTELTPTPHFRV
jgi:hypothetical protein